jgi:hypothetical protein
MAATVELIGLDKLKDTFKQLPKELRPILIQNVARKVSTPIVREARHLVPQLTGRTAKSIGVLKVKNKMQPYVEVGFKGKSLGFIYLVGAPMRKKKSGASTGSIQRIPNPFHRAADRVGAGVKREFNADIGRVIGKYLKRRGYTVRG